MFISWANSGCSKIETVMSGRFSEQLQVEEITPSLVEKVVTGEAHSCALKEGKAYCWGKNDNGQLGTQTDPPNSNSTTPVEVQNLNKVVDISTSHNFTCALLENQTVKCWGENTYKQLGALTANDYSATPVQVQNLANVIKISSGYYHACALLSDNDVYCWGKYDDGRLGYNATESSLVANPVTFTTSDPIKDLSTGNMHSCAILENGAVFCWGKNDYGQLGDDPTSTLSSSQPTIIEGTYEVASLLSAGNSFNCVAMSAGGIKCLGQNDSDAGQLGKADLLELFSYSFIDVDVLAGKQISSVSSNSSHSCVVIEKKIYCWGKNDYGQLGNGTIDSPLTSVLVTDSEGATSVAAGKLHSCAVIKGEVFCWGRNNQGQLGDGTTENSLKLVKVEFE